MAAAGERGLSEAAHGHQGSLEAGSEITGAGHAGPERERERAAAWDTGPGLARHWSHSPDSTLSNQGSPLATYRILVLILG